LAWIILLLAGLCEVAWAVGLKYSEGFTRFWAGVGTVGALLLSLGLLNLALKSLPVGTAYPVWVGIGSIGTVLFGIFFFNEAVSLGRMVSIAMVIAGIIGLQLCATH
jgi:quaternary ammonium compound-resistance protein SugE